MFIHVLFRSSYLDSITPTRYFNLLYIILDCVFLAILAGLLIWKKKYQTLLFGLFGGILYFIVDYGGFYLLSGSRTVSTIMQGAFDTWKIATGPQTFFVLLWMSLSYGFTNFVFIWTLMKPDRETKYWIFLILLWWFVCPSIAEMGGEATIKTSRTTGKYHGIMAIILIVGYLLLTIYFLMKKVPFKQMLSLFLIGVSVQFGWELALLVNGIRPSDFASLRTLIINSLIETNLGMPIIYVIFHFFRNRWNEDLTKIDNVKETHEESERKGADK
ncbi:MAG: hypothetical protein SOR23_02350 [Candidatus Enterosoma sp.]|nr:hypothetical protein [Candidatus Enterosoma sp.]